MQNSWNWITVPKLPAAAIRFLKTISFLTKIKTLSPNKTATSPKTTSVLAKAHVPTAGFAPSDMNKLQAGMEVEHERFWIWKSHQPGRQ